MGQTLFIQKKFYESVQSNINIIKTRGYGSAEEFFNGIIERLNDEYNFFKIEAYKLCNKDIDCSLYSQYGAFVYGDDLPFEKVVIFFTPISSKIGNVIIEQSFMPTICNHMKLDLKFLIDNKYKKIAILTSNINNTNSVSAEYNKLQMDVNSLNTLNIDVIPFFPIKNLSTNTRFTSLDEYLDMSNYLQRKLKTNSQFEYLTIQNNILYGKCEKNQLVGEFIKSFCFRFLTAIFSGKNDYIYDISLITNLFEKLDNQFSNLNNFIDYINSHTVFPHHEILCPIDNDIVIIYDDIDKKIIEDIHRIPERAFDMSGRMRFKVQKKIKDIVLQEAEYLCNCHNDMHFYFESMDNHNYLEGHHIIPMNRQEEYYFDRQINLDNKYNLIPLCPNCHSQIHFGSRSARLKIIRDLYILNEKKLKLLNKDITIQLLATYYNIGLEDDEADKLLKL